MANGSIFLLKELTGIKSKDFKIILRMNKIQINLNS